jgi:hypothetical protein
MLHAQPIEHVFFAVLLVARLADVLTTRVATPRLALEANPIARRLGWPFAWLTLAIAFVAYLDVGVAWALAVMSFLVAGQNARVAWLARALGEERFLRDVVLPAARGGRKSLAFGLIAVSSVLAGIVGLGIMVLGYDNGWAWMSGAGILGFAFANLIHQSIAWRRYFRMVGADDQGGGPATR